MVAQVLVWLEVQPNDRILDLLFGMDDFTLPLTRSAVAVAGVEGVATLVANGQYNAHNAWQINTSFFHESLEDHIERQFWVA